MSASNQKVIVLDNPPHDADAWAQQVFAAAKLKQVNNRLVSDTMAKDEAAKKALLASKDPLGDAEKLAPHYKAAFDKLYSTEARVGCWGTAWLVYQQPIAACVVDWSGIEKAAATDKKGVDAVPYEHFRKTSYDFVRARATKFLDPKLYLELPLGLTTAQKVEQTLDFLKRLGVV